MRCARIRALLLSPAVVAAIALAGCGEDDEPTRAQDTAPAPVATATTTTGRPPARAFTNAELRAIGAGHARRELGIQTPADEVALHRSTRDPRWAIVSGARARELWVVWLRDGDVRIATTDVMRFDPPSVPCDVRPAFSEPSC